MLCRKAIQRLPPPLTPRKGAGGRPDFGCCKAMVLVPSSNSVRMLDSQACDAERPFSVCCRACDTEKRKLKEMLE